MQKHWLVGNTAFSCPVLNRHLSKPEEFWINAPLIDETKEMLNHSAQQSVKDSSKADKHLEQNDKKKKEKDQAFVIAYSKSRTQLS